MNKIEIKNIKKTYNERCVLDNISISIENNTTTAILGPSGCGKTTLFNIVAGFESPDLGSVFLDGKEITNTTGKVGYMTQKDLLLPYKTPPSFAFDSAFSILPKHRDFWYLYAQIGRNLYSV